MSRGGWCKSNALGEREPPLRIGARRRRGRRGGSRDALGAELARADETRDERARAAGVVELEPQDHAVASSVRVRSAWAPRKARRGPPYKRAARSASRRRARERDTTSEPQASRRRPSGTPCDQSACAWRRRRSTRARRRQRQEGHSRRRARARRGPVHRPGARGRRRPGIPQGGGRLATIDVPAARRPRAAAPRDVAGGRARGARAPRGRDGEATAEGWHRESGRRGRAAKSSEGPEASGTPNQHWAGVGGRDGGAPDEARLADDAALKDARVVARGAEPLTRTAAERPASRPSTCRSASILRRRRAPSRADASRDLVPGARARVRPAALSCGRAGLHAFRKSAFAVLVPETRPSAREAERARTAAVELKEGTSAPAARPVQSARQRAADAAPPACACTRGRDGRVRVVAFSLDPAFRRRACARAFALQGGGLREMERAAEAEGIPPRASCAATRARRSVRRGRMKELDAGLIVVDQSPLRLRASGARRRRPRPVSAHERARGVVRSRGAPRSSRSAPGRARASSRSSTPEFLVGAPTSRRRATRSSPTPHAGALDAADRDKAYWDATLRGGRGGEGGRRGLGACAGMNAARRDRWSTAS